MSVRVYVPDETTACALGADAVAAAIATTAATRADVELVRNGSRGLFYLEPLVEVATDQGRIGFANVTAAQAAELFAGGVPSADHALCIGVVEHLDYLAQQTRLTFARAGVTEPLSLPQYEAHGGLVGLRRALTLAPQAIVDAIKTSGLRGRGGAAFPAGIKWQTVLDAPGERKYIACNADEGDSGTFADRLLIECDPFQLIEGMAIAGVAVGATEGVVYLRSEYPKAHAVLQRALVLAREAGILGAGVLGSTKAFDIRVVLGAGAYVCGEETSMLESIEGKRGVVRKKPPLPALAGLFGCPTVVNNVLTLAAATTILADGGEHYAGFGSGRSRGTMPFQLAGNLERGGLVELPFGPTVGELLERFAGGTRSGRPLAAVQMGGPLGAYLAADGLDVPLDYEAAAAAGALIGHGGIVAFDDTVDMGAQAEFAMRFCALESCGKCTPCRVGAVRGQELIARLRVGDAVEDNLVLLDDLLETMELGSLCALGGLTPMPVRSILNAFPAALGKAR